MTHFLDGSYNFRVFESFSSPEVTRRVYLESNSTFLARGIMSTRGDVTPIWVRQMTRRVYLKSNSKQARGKLHNGRAS